MKKLKVIFSLFILLIITFMIIFSCYIKNAYTNVPFEELYFYLLNGVTNSDTNVFMHAIIQCSKYILILYLFLCIIFYDITFGKIKFKYYPIKIINKHRKILIIFLFIFSVFFALYNLNYFNYVQNSSNNSNFIELNYVNPKTTKIEFETKKNLIFIVSESLETSFFTKKQGGYWDYDVTPELYKLLNEKDSITFYNDDNIAHGMKMITGASYTTASVFANTSGLPFKIPIDGNSYHSKDFMNGAYTLGDLLYDNGYKNELISSATTSFGGIKEYFTKHGKFNIIDVENVTNYDSEIKKGDYGEWGLNDNYLFKIAKKRLENLSSNSQPFNLTLIGIDAHFPNGLLGDYSLDKYNTQYENVYATESKLIYNFISWVKKQDFYKDTTIVIVGDHISMQREYFNSRGIYDRYVYNCIINSYINTDNYSSREFSALDTYPTTVSAIGGKIEDNKLGLGVNLFSNEKTMLELYSYDYIDNELLKKSEFYDRKIIDDKYIDDKIKKLNKKEIVKN